MIDFAKELRIKRSRAEIPSKGFYIPAPEGLEYRPFQLACGEYSKDIGNILIADEPGLGKTIETAAIINLKRRKKILLMVPSSLVINWHRELQKWLVGKFTFEIYHPKTYWGRSDILIVSHYWLSFESTLKDIAKRGIHDTSVYDEVHNLKGSIQKKKSGIAKMAFTRNGFLNRAYENIALSGTPMENRPVEIYYLIRALAPDVLGDMSFWEYGLKYCGGFNAPYGWDFNGKSNLTELGRKLRSSVMIRRTKKQVLKDLPDKVINFVYLEPSKTSRAVIKKLVPFEKAIINRTIDIEFSSVSTLRRELGVSKVEDAVDYILTQYGGGRKKIIIFAHHKEVLGMVKDALSERGLKVLLINGSIKGSARQRAVDLFQSDPLYDFMLLAIRAGGVGLTLTASDYMIGIEGEWVPGKWDQVFDRVHRIGQLNSVQIDLLTYENTLDERIIQSNLEKREGMKELYNDEND